MPSKIAIEAEALIADKAYDTDAIVDGDRSWHSAGDTAQVE